MANPNARGKIGNVGGGRKGYEYEEEQLKKMRQHVNWLFAYVDAVRKGKDTDKLNNKFIKLEKVLLKEMDKLHANKQQTDITSGGKEIQIPIFGGLSNNTNAGQSIQNNSGDQKDIPAPEENPGSVGGNGSK